MARTDMHVLDTPAYKLICERYKVSKSELAELIKQHRIDPVLLEKLLSLVLDRYRSLDTYGSRAALQRLVEELIEANTNPDEDEEHVA